MKPVCDLYFHGILGLWLTYQQIHHEVMSGIGIQRRWTIGICSRSHLHSPRTQALPLLTICSLSPYIDEVCLGKIGRKSVSCFSTALPRLLWGRFYTCCSLHFVLYLHGLTLLLFLPFSFQRKLHVPYYSYAESNTNLPLRAVHPNVAASKLPGPLEHPDGWTFLPEVVMHLQPIPRSKGREHSVAKKEMAFKVKFFEMFPPRF